MNQPLRAVSSAGRRHASPSTRSVFLHGMWRSGSTYVWSRFREAEDACCFYEPLHPGLGRLTRRRIPRDTEATTAANRHPRLSRPYFAEYEPLLGLRGVKGFNRGLIFDRFALRPWETHEALRRYLARLTGHADGQNKVGVLGFNQSSLRIGWLRAQFDSFDVHVEREPRDIWLSYMEHMLRDNFTYFRMWLQVIEQNRRDPLFAPLAERLPLRRGADLLVKPKRYYARVIRELPPEMLYLMVFYLWIACCLHALTTCDLVIDTGLAGRRGYGHHLAARVAAGSGLQVSFDDLRTAPPAVNLGLGAVHRIEAEALRIFPKSAFGAHFDPAIVRGRLGEIAARKAELLSEIL